jgi:serine protease
MAHSKWIPWGVLMAVLAGSSALWHGPATHSPESKPQPSSADRAQAAGLDPTSLIVDFRDDISPEALATNGYTEIPISDYSAHDRLYRIDFATADEAAAARDRLSRDRDVESVDYDSIATIPPDEAVLAGDSSMEAECQGQAGAADGSGAFPNDTCYHYQWHLGQIHMPEAWKLGNGKGVVVAVIDTGVSKVADLKDTKFVPGYNFVANNDNADDDHGHGTHVAGTIAEATNNKIGVAGVAYGAAIMPLKVLSSSGSGSMAAIAQAIRWAADHGAGVINMSLGGPFPVGTINSAIQYARSKGVVVVAAAGNDGRGKVSYPARYPGVIAVASTQFDESPVFYSNWGPEIDVAAPGGNTRVDQNGDGKPDGVLQHTIVPGNISKTDYLWFMGTSMASPHVAGVVALIEGAGVRKPDAVEEVLLDTARKPKASGAAGGRIDDHYGSGIVDAAAALKKVRTGRGAGELGIGAALAFLGVSLLRRRGRGVERLGLGFVAALVAGSSGLFLLPLLVPAGHPLVATLSSGFALSAAGVLGPAAYGNPLLWSALVPLLLTALLYGARRTRPALAGFGFGVAGALAFAALSGTIDVRFVPDFLDRAWLCVNAVAATLLAAAVIRKA